MKWEYWSHLFLNRYCTAKGLQPKTIESYRDILDEFQKYVANHLEQKLPDEITSGMLCDYIEFLKKSRTNGQATLNKKVTVIRVFYRAMVALEEIVPGKDPCAKLPRLKKPSEKAGDILSLEEIQKLAAAPSSETLMGLRDRAILLLLCTTGIRASECAGIKEGDVDLSNRIIRVLGKGARERIIVLNDTMIKAIENYIKFRGVQSRQSAFFKVRTGKGIDRKRIFERVKYYLKKARIFKKISPHRLRHSFATKMIKDGVGLATLKELLGHRSLQSTMRYVHVAGEDLRKAISKLKIDDTFEKVVAMLPHTRLRYQKATTASSG